MTFLENEEQLDTLSNTVLTNYRILKEEENSYKISIFLEKISSIEMHYKQKIYLILLGICSVFGGLYIAQGEEMIITAGIILGVVFIIAYFVTRKHVITITPDGGKNLDIEVQGVKNERIEEFITNIQKAKQEK